MNKNLKKVISTIAALAVSASSMVAFATGYPDVPETATYAQAVKELSALNVISGYEDGTFLPDKNVTRAEITKMIVTSLGSATLSAANAAAGKDTKFADVPGSHWASGFVSTATANANSNNGFINGYDETTFGPDDNVTYAQAIKMLVSALGYQTYAENNGGWPNGYLNYGYTLEIADGVTGVSNDTQVTRAQVAQMIDNAIKAPICVIDGYETQWNGTQTPKFKVKDSLGTGKNSWQCLLNYSHDAYVVNGRVMATQKQGGNLKADEVTIKIEKSNNYNGNQIVPSGTVSGAVETAFEEKAYVGDSSADQYLFTYAEMVLQLNEDEEVTILSIVPVGAESKSVEFATEDFAKDKSDVTSSTGRALAVYESSNTTSTDKYEIADNAKMYVNSVNVGNVIAENATNVNTANVNAYIAGNTTGTVTLIDSPDAGKSSVDGIYDYVMVSYYKDAIVDSVVGDEEEATIYFKDSDLGEGTMDVDMTDDKKSYSFTLTDGTELSVLDLQENDILSIAYDAQNTSGFSASDSYEVLVSRDTVEGKITSKDEDTNDQTKTEFMINGEAYGVTSTTLVNPTKLNVSYEYTLYLNAFGKIAKFEETATSNKLAILENVYSANGGQYYATIVTPDGAKETYTIKDKSTADAYVGKCYDGVTSVASTYTASKHPIQERVYAYSVSATTGNITLKGEGGTSNAYVGVPAVDQYYKESSTKIGSLRINEALTSILDVAEGYDKNGDEVSTESKEYGAMTLDLLEDEGQYSAYGFNKLSDNSYQFVIVTDGTSGSVTYKTQFVVYSKQYTKEVDGEDMTAYLVYDGEGEAKEVVLDSSCTAPATINEGTPIVIKKNSLGYAKEVTALFQPTVLGDYDDFAAAVRADMKAKDATDTDFMSNVLDKAALDSVLNKAQQGGTSAWVFGMVYDRSGSNISIASDFDETYTYDHDKNDATPDVTSTACSNIDALKEYDVEDDANIIIYSYKERAGRGARVSNSVLSAVLKMSASTALVDANDTIFDWEHDSVKSNENSTFGRTSFVLAKTIDGDIVEAYFIVPSSSRN